MKCLSKRMDTNTNIFGGGPPLRQVLKRRLVQDISEIDDKNGGFALNPQWQRDRQDLGTPDDLKDAGVLVPIIERAGDATVLLTQRTEHLSSHAGQIAFPGGRVDREDGGPLGAALRETHEEVGIEPHRIDVHGFLDTYETGSGFRIHPVVGFVDPDFTLTINQHEVAEAFEVPLAFLMDPKNHEKHSAVWRGKRREYYAIPFGDYYIWGATAGILVAMYRTVFGGGK